MKKNNNGGAMSVMHLSVRKAGVWTYEKRRTTEIAANQNNETTDMTAKNTDLAFTVNIKGDLFSIGE